MKSFEEIYQEHNATMIRAASKMVDDSDVVSDIVQEVFIYLHEKLSEGKKILHMRSWLYKATFNKCVDHLRNRKSFVNIESIKNVRIEQETRIGNYEKTILIRALNELEDKEKILVVGYSEGLSYRELADLTGIKFTSIGKTLFRTLFKLKVKLKKKKYEMFE